MNTSSFAFGLLLSGVMVSNVTVAATSAKIPTASQAQKQVSQTLRAQEATASVQTPKLTLSAHLLRVGSKIEFARQRVNQSTQLSQTESQKITQTLLNREAWIKAVEKAVAGDLSSRPLREKAQFELTSVRDQLESSNVANKRYRKTRITGTMSEADLKTYSQALLADISAEITTLTFRYDRVLASAESVKAAQQNLGETRVNQAAAQKAVEAVKPEAKATSLKVKTAEKALTLTEESLKKTGANVSEVQKNLR